MRLRCLLLCALTLANATQAADLASYFQGIDGTFVLLDGRTGQYTRYNEKRAAERFPPCSTFKVPNSAIALETGVATDPQFTLRYDPALQIQNPDWARDQSLRSAYRVSAVWYFQEIARRVGADRMGKLVRQMQYGNQDISGGIDRFWLGNSLRISADEQVRFLQRLHLGQLGLSARTTQLMKDVMVADQGPGWVLRAKTGACRAAGEPVFLWYVGYVERDDRAYYFALEMGAREYEPLMSQRVTKAKAILTELGVLPARR